MIIYIFIIILLLITVLLVIRIKFPPTRLLDQKTKEKFYMCMDRFDKMCADNNIKYFAVAGTLLGSVRHKDVIPWDDDMDVGVTLEDHAKLKTIDLSKYGLSSHDIEIGSIGKVFLSTESKIPMKYETYIDIFCFGEEDGKLIYTSEYSRKSWPNEYFYKDEVFPLKRYQFGPVWMNGPKEYLPYCERAWGKNWKIPKVKRPFKFLYPFDNFKFDVIKDMVDNTSEEK